MMLKQWAVTDINRPIERTAFCVVILENGNRTPAKRAELWRLDDYRVTSVQGGAIWLAKK